MVRVGTLLEYQAQYWRVCVICSLCDFEFEFDFDFKLQDSKESHNPNLNPNQKHATVNNGGEAPCGFSGMLLPLKCALAR